MGTEWKATADGASTFEGRDRARATAGGPAPGSTWSSARTPSCGRWPRSTPRDDAQGKFVHDFVAAWAKVMDLDRFDLR